MHGYLRRKHCGREQRENDTIIISVILCLIARVQNTQYTKALLPEFLIPHNVIRLHNLVEATELPKSERSEAVVCEFIGYLDPRTARRQLRRRDIRAAMAAEASAGGAVEETEEQTIESCLSCRAATVIDLQFSDNAKMEIYRRTGGIARAANSLCYRGILHGAIEKKQVIDTAGIPREAG